MKKLFFSGLLSILFFSITYAQYGTERTGYEGDYFSLEGAIELFKQAHSIRDFERKINSEKTWVNNLDLNYDGRIDYIRVEHRRQGNFHAIILQALIDKYDVQDVAVIEIEKVGRRDVVLQIIGDPDLYGEEVIVEPYDIGYTSSRGGSDGYYAANEYVNVYYWPVVQSIFNYGYQVYSSPYRWSYYPSWWRPWRQFTWNIYFPRVRHYHRHCHVVKIYRAPRVHQFYRPHRSHSRHVAQRTQKIRSQRKSSAYRPSTSNRKSPNSYGKGDRKVSQRPGTTSVNPRNKATIPSRQKSPVGNQGSPRVNKPTNITTSQSTRITPNRNSTGRTMNPEHRTNTPDQVRKSAPSKVQPSSPSVNKSTRNSNTQAYSAERKERTTTKSGTERRINPNNQVRKSTSPKARPSSPSVNKSTRSNNTRMYSPAHKERSMTKSSQEKRASSGNQSSKKPYPSAKRAEPKQSQARKSTPAQRQKSSAQKRNAPSRTRN